MNEGDWPRKYQLDSILISPMLDLKLNLIDIFLANPLHNFQRNTYWKTMAASLITSTVDGSILLPILELAAGAMVTLCHGTIVAGVGTFHTTLISDRWVVDGRNSNQF
jgi:hypothetical protein